MGEQIILSRILPVMGSSRQGYRNCMKMAINRGSWLSGDVLLGVLMRDGLHLIGKGAAVFADELSAAVDSGIGSSSRQWHGKQQSTVAWEAAVGSVMGSSS